MIIIDGIIFKLQRQGGIRTYFNEFIKYLLKNKIEFKIFLYDSFDLDDEFRQYCILKKSRFLERYRRCNILQYKGIFISSYYRRPSSSCKSICIVHDFVYEYFVGGIKKFIHNRQKFSAVASSDRIVCISENTKNDLLKFFPSVDTELISVVHNGVGSDFFPFCYEPSRYKTKNSVLFIGSRAKYKNFNLLVDALKFREDLNLYVIGGGKFTNLESYLLNSSIPGRYRHFISINNAKLNALYNEAFCLVYPSSYEGFGIPILEAMKAGCPVISFNRSSIPEVAGDAALLYDDISAESINLGLIELSNSQVRSLLITKGFQHSQQFSWNKTFDRFLPIFNDLLHAFR